MSSTTARLLIAAGTAAATALTLGAVAAAPATAATSSFSDARGDFDHGADIHEVTVAHGKRVRITVEHEDLVRSYKSGSSVRIYLDVNRRQAGPEYAFVGGTFEGADYALVRTDGWRLEQRVAVTGFHRLDLDYAADLAVVRVGRRVLGDPDAVRVAVKTGGEMVHEGQEPHNGVDWLGERRELTDWVAQG